MKRLKTEYRTLQDRMKRPKTSEDDLPSIGRSTIGTNRMSASCKVLIQNMGKLDWNIRTKFILTGPFCVRQYLALSLVRLKSSNQMKRQFKWSHALQIPYFASSIHSEKIKNRDRYQDISWRVPWRTYRLSTLLLPQ